MFENVRNVEPRYGIEPWTFSLPWIGVEFRSRRRGA
jgi:hypothetical protein